MDYQKPSTHARDHRDDHNDPLNGPTFPLVDAGGDPPNPDDVLDEDYSELTANYFQPASPHEQWGPRRGLRAVEFVGVLDASSAASGEVATYLPEQLRPPVDLVVSTAVLVGDTITPASAHVAAADGAVAVSWSSGASLPFASLATGYVEVDPGGSGDYNETADFTSATLYANSPVFSKDSDPAGFDGISCPGQKLLQVITWLESPGDTPPGQHVIGWKIGGSVAGGIRYFGPVPAGNQVSAWTNDFASMTVTTTMGLFNLSQLARHASADPFVIGVAHYMTGVTTPPYLFKYGITVTVLGDLPVAV